MNNLLSLIPLLLSVNAVPQDSWHNPDLPVCIIGAGISGLRVGQNLESKGYYNVKVFEKSNRVGGKIETFRANGNNWNVGPVLVTDHFVKIQKLIKKFNLKTQVFPVDDVIGYNEESGYSTLLPSIVKDEKVIAAFEKYRKIRKRLNVEPGYVNASPELFISSAEWLKKNGLEALDKVALIFVTLEGYGSLDDTPAIYTIHILDLINDIRNNFYQLPNGMDEIPKNLAKGLDITLNADVYNIIRGQESSQIFYRDNRGYERNERCVSVVLAFPPTLNEVKKIVPGLTKKEQKVLNQVSIVKYASFANYAPGLKHTAYAPLLPPAIGDGRTILWINQTQNAFVSYSWLRGDFKEPANESEMASFEAKLRTVFPKLSPGVEGEIAIAKRSWSYFPHVNVESLKNGFYEDFVEIQGNQGLHYSTPLLSMETMERSIDAADYLVKDYF